MNQPVKGDGPMVQITVDADTLAHLRTLIAELDAFRREQNPGGQTICGSPRCGWFDYDTTVLGYAMDIAETAEKLL